MLRTRIQKHPVILVSGLGFFLALLLAASPVNAQWKAYNDHRPGTIPIQTSSNATTLNCWVPGSITLKNIADGSELFGISGPITLTITTNGISGSGSTAGTPANGTPLAEEFNGYVYFGTGSNPGACILVHEDGTITYTFSGLNPSKRYIFKGGAVRNGNYTNRWTLADISGVESVAPAHQQGASSPWGYMDAHRMPGVLTGYQVAINTGVNASGDMFEWDDIDPGADGTFSVTCTQWEYNNPVASGYGTNSLPCYPYAPSDYSYAITGLSLEELPGSGGFTATIFPENVSLAQCDTVTLRASASGGVWPYLYQWSVDGIELLYETNATLDLSNVQVSQAGMYSVRVTDSLQNSPELDPISIVTITPNVGTPVLLEAIGIPDLYHVTVTFSRPVAISGVGAIQLQGVQGGGILAVTDATVVNQTNVVLTTSQPRTGKYRVVVQANAVTEPCNGSAVPAGASADVLDTLLLLAWNSTWRYNQEGVEQGLDWKNYSYPSEALWPQGAGVFDAKDNPRTTVAGLNVGTQLQLTNSSWNFGTNNLPTYYFRSYVDWPGDALLEQTLVLIRTCWDDAGVVYINGNEVYRSGTITANSLFFTNYLGSATEAAISTYIPVSASHFVPGENVVAVYLKQGNSTSSDITMGLEMTVIITNYYVVGGPVTVAVNPTSANLVQCNTLTLNGTANGGTRPYVAYQWTHNGVLLSNGGNISGADSNTLVVSTVLPNQNSGTYRLIVTDSAALKGTSAPVQVTVTAESAPMILSAVGATDLRTITLTFDKPMTIASATGADFLVRALDGIGNLTVTNAYVNTNANEVILRTAQAREQKNYEVVVQGNGVTGGCGQTAVQNGASARLESQILIFGLTFEDVWQYNDAGVDLGDAWLLNSYDDHNLDAGWRTGTALFDGYRDNLRTTVGGQSVDTHLAMTNATTIYTDSTHVIPTYYFRKHFTLPLAIDMMTLSCRTFFDDQGIIYLNGQEAWRDTVSIVATNRAFDTYLHRGTVNTPSFSVDIPLPMTNLFAGDNIIAVYLKQTAPTSSDITMGLELIATVADWPPAGPRLKLTPINSTQVTVIWSPAGGTLEASTDLRSWSAAGVGNGGTVTISSGKKFFRVVQ